MLNRNFSRTITTLLRSGTSGNVPITKIDGTTDTITANVIISYFTSASFAASKIGSLASGKSTFVIGSSTQAESIDDYYVITPIDDTDFSITSASCTASGDDSIIYSQNWSYAGSTAVTINEVALVMYFSPKKVAISRIKLDTPISLPASSSDNPTLFTLSMAIGSKVTA